MSLTIGIDGRATYARSESVERPAEVVGARRLKRGVLTWVVLFAAIVLVQIYVGAYHAERGNYSDEAAHFMNGLLVRDYLQTGIGISPLAFAEDYYLHYPKIAPMMWPPFFHLILGLVLLPGWSPHAAALLLVAFATAWTAWRLSRLVETVTDRVSGFVAAALFVLTSVVIDASTAVMLDVVVAALALEATHWFAEFIRTRKRRHAIAFGVLAACCCMTKGNGLSTLLVPGMLIALTGQFSVLKSKALWIAAAIVAGIACPIVTVSFTLDSGMGGYSLGNVTRIAERTLYYSSRLRLQLGAVIVALAAVGVVARGTWGWRRVRDERCASVAGMTALLLSALAFHVLGPHEVIGIRYMVLGIAPIIGLAAVGAATIAEWIPANRVGIARSAMLVASIGNFWMVKPPIVHRVPLGYHQAAERLVGSYGLERRRLVVVSDEEGEGALVADVAAREIRPAPTLIRGSKLIAFEDWSGGRFRMNVASSAELVQKLEDLHVTFLVIDESVQLPYSAMVHEMLERYTDRFESLGSIQRSRRLSLYRLRHSTPGPAEKVEAEVGALRRVLRQE